MLRESHKSRQILLLALVSNILIGIGFLFNMFNEAEALAFTYIHTEFFLQSFLHTVVAPLVSVLI